MHDHGRGEFDEPLGIDGETGWKELRAVLERDTGSWLGFVFSEWAPGVAALRTRAERLVKPRSQSLLLFQPKRPDEMTGMLPALLRRAESPEVACTWIEALRWDPPDSPDPAWTRAWEAVLYTVNARRAELARRLPGGLVFAAPPDLKAGVRLALRDLWAARSLLIELAARPRAVSLSGPLDSAATNLRPTIDRLLAERRIDEARAALLDMMEALRGGDLRPLTEVMALLAIVEQEDGDAAAAADHIELAIRTRRRLGADAVPLKWYDQAGRLALERGDVESAAARYAEAESAARARLERGETPDALRGLAIALIKVGDLRRDTGDLFGAADTFEESLLVSRRLAALRGETPEALRDLSIALERAGDGRRDIADDDAAAAAYEESLALARRLRAHRGDTPEALRDLVLALGKVGAASARRDDHIAAIAAYEERVAVARKLVAAAGHRRTDPELLISCLRELAGALHARANAIESEVAGMESTETAG